MKRIFVDTNLLIRYLTNDDPAKAGRVEQWLDKAAAGEVKLVTAEMVLAETVWVLESSYGLSNTQVAPLIRGILATPGLEVLNAALVTRALDHYQALRVDFVDGYIAAVMEKQGIDEILSFDRKHMPRLKGVRHREP
ncbi:MAG: PIN domain-containing protein [Deferrisomatales bacterium]